ncbi:PBSP domain protein [Talaromyces stipitatus ATCC 10500]|uniref:PBSP domain protein n=1 Tax=Talaromyces stipitatus (strain ATCC 10500 / CBS 375.48 / QM 6759 / NRRL 1006) TaxID=441959 RepID=B8M2E7_TALSN|nr:PBSP domain protein [Talaromyces stipitatus ATCC 10500]EED21611.1 PBSP domain protein [Talaromyces stipitatus ATCC 10500]
MTTTKIPTPSPLPVLTKPPTHQVNNGAQPTRKEKIPKPKLRLRLQDARHPAAASFFGRIPDLEAVLDSALTAIVEQLYTSPRRHHDNGNDALKAFIPSFVPFIPPTRSVTIILEDFDGVAYTNGTDLDDDHKEIHFSLSYIDHVCKNNAQPLAELEASDGNNNKDNNKDIPRPPGGLIEGIADFVRLKAGLGALHWQKPKSASDRASGWDAGYQHTAYFLAWLEDVRVGQGAIGMLNDRLLRTGYLGELEDQEKDKKPGFWRGLFGVEVDNLWEEYGRYLDKDVREGIE